MPDDAFARPVLNILQASAGILDEGVVHVDERKEEQQGLGQQKELNGQLNLPGNGKSYTGDKGGQIRGANDFYLGTNSA